MTARWVVNTSDRAVVLSHFTARYPLYGYRRILALMRREGWCVSERTIRTYLKARRQKRG